MELGQVQIDRLPAPTFAALAEWLSRNEVHILHVSGHGDDPLVEEDVVYLEDRDGRANGVRLRRPRAVPARPYSAATGSPQHVPVGPGGRS